MRYRALTFVILATGGIGLLALQSGDIVNLAHADDKLDHKEAKELREQGKILPLKEILDRVGKEYPGQVIETELDREDGNYIYELEILTDKDKVIELEVDAASGKILKTEKED
ncbi:MAG: PepSY domain-containing protein [Thiohalophilus sp.]|jgi:uncharacterized membrane protein YkoI